MQLLSAVGPRTREQHEHLTGRCLGKRPRPRRHHTTTRSHHRPRRRRPGRGDRARSTPPRDRGAEVRVRGWASLTAEAVCFARAIEGLRGTIGSLKHPRKGRDKEHQAPREPIPSPSGPKRGHRLTSHKARCAPFGSRSAPRKQGFATIAPAPGTPRARVSAACAAPSPRRAHP
jgi:hypothetical protein